MRKTVLITGVSGGIGKELADRFARDGYEMVLVARSEAKILELATHYQMTYGVGVTVIAKDIAAPGVPQEIFEELRQKKIQVDYLINNAGFGLFGPFVETDLEQETNMIDVNIKALTIMTKLFLPYGTAESGGRHECLLDGRLFPGTVDVGLSCDESIRPVVHGSP